jgi:hypothetical protein
MGKSVKYFQKTLLAAAVLGSSFAHAQNVQWQVQMNQPAPAPAHVVRPAPPPAVVVPPAPTVESVQQEQATRIRWGVQVGFITPQLLERLTFEQNQIEQNRRRAYADRYLSWQEQLSIYSQINQLSADIDYVMLKSSFARPYFAQFGTPIPVWSEVSNGWLTGRYELQADEHHRRGFRYASPPAPPAPVVVQPAPSAAPVPTAAPMPSPPQGPRLRDLLEQLLNQR